MSKKPLCPFCKLCVDEDDTYQAYRKSKEYKSEKYPEWAYIEDNLFTHLLNFHRLPKKMATFFIAGLGLRDFLKDHPEFKVGIALPKGEKE